MWSAEQIKEAGLEDFRVFLAQVWDHLQLRRIACKAHEAEGRMCSCPTPMQNDIAKYLQHGPRRRMVRAFRGVGKSWMTCAYVAWRLFMNPQIKVMIVSANQNEADNSSKFIKSMIQDIPMLSFLKPDLLKDQRRANIAFDVGPARPDKSPSVKSVGIKGQLTGSRANLIVSDDVEVPKNSMTYIMREQLAELVKEYDSVLSPGGEVIYLGTPQVEQSLYNRLPARGYEIRVWPAEVPVSLSPYGDQLTSKVIKTCEGVKACTPIDIRFNEEELAQRMASYGKAGYALQFLLDTSPADIEKHPLKLGDLIVFPVDREMAPVKIVWGSGPKQVVEELMPGGFDGDFYHSPAWVSPEFAKFSGTVMAIDPSGTGQDETAYAIVRYHHSQLYLVAVGGYKDGFSEKTLQGLALMAQRHGVNEITMERNYGGGMFGQLLRPIVHKVCKAKILDPEDCPWSTGQKEVRILNSLEPLIQTHRLTVDVACIEKDWELQQEKPALSWVFQMTRMHRERGALSHEDRLEAIQLACQHWLDRMDIDQDTSFEVHKEGLMDDELQSFMDHVWGRPPEGDLTWM